MPDDRQMFYTGEGTDAPFLTAVRRLWTDSAATVYRHMLERFCSMENANKNEMEKFFQINQFWGSFAPAQGDYGVFQNRAKELTNHAQDFLWLYRRLSDFRSRFVLRAVIGNWLDLDCIPLSAAIEKIFANYFDPDIMKCDVNEVLVDLGACTGDTVADYINTYGREYKKIYCYEITPDLFVNMRQTLLEQYHFENIELRQKGAGEKSGQMYLKENAFTSSGNALADTGELAVEVVSIDEDITEPVTFIKMDIEGAEQAAIRGCRKHIAEDKPKLALSLYHSNEDIWKIPRMIDEICPGYRFYLRYHGGDLVPSELTLLAVYGGLSQ